MCLGIYSIFSSSPHLFPQICCRGAHLAFPAAHIYGPLPTPQCFTPSNAVCTNIFFSPFFSYWRKVTDKFVHIRLLLLSIFMKSRWLSSFSFPSYKMENSKSKCLEILYICMGPPSPSTFLMSFEFIPFYTGPLP